MILSNLYGKKVMDMHTDALDGIEHELALAIARARAVQKLGYDIGFAFMQQFADAPFLHLCLGRYHDKPGFGMGYDAFSRAQALNKAVSEVVERALFMEQGVYWQEKSTVAPQSELKGHALYLTDLAGFSAADRKLLNSGYDEKTPFRWSLGVTLDSDDPIYVPSQLVSGRFVRDLDGAEPLLRESNTNGLATGHTFEEAAFRGLLELIERDAFMITYHNRISPPRIDPHTVASKESQTLLAEFARHDLSCDMVLLPTDAPVTVVCVIIRDSRGGPAFALGAKAHEYPEAAVRGALMEALGIWLLVRFFGTYAKELAGRALTQAERVAFWAKPENARRLSWLCEGPRVPLPKSPYTGTLRDLAKTMRDRGSECAAIEMSHPTLHAIDMHSVCVVSPQLLPINLEGDSRYDGGRRVTGVPRKLGITTHPQHEYPHPFP